jgi:hypothetical protein
MDRDVELEMSAVREAVYPVVVEQLAGETM